MENHRTRVSVELWIDSLSVTIDFELLISNIQSGFLSILYSIGSKPLQIWDAKNRNGHIKRITDNDIQSLVLEIEGTNVATTYITCPADPKKTLGIKLPFLVMIIKNLKKYFTFEVQVSSRRESGYPVLSGNIWNINYLSDICRFLMTKMFDVGSAHQTINQPLV